MNSYIQRRWSHKIIISLATTAIVGCASIAPKEPVVGAEIYFSHASSNHKSDGVLLEQPDVKIDSNQTGTDFVVYFESDSAQLTQSEIESLQSYLLSFKRGAAHLFLITGHTDSNHSDIYNMGLSERRALAVKDELLRMGVPETQTAWRAVGETVPIASNSDEGGRTLNRRVTIKIVR